LQLAVTSHGRIICWELQGTQIKIERSKWFACFAACCPSLCSAPVAYGFNARTRVYRATHIRQIMQFINSTALCCQALADYGCSCCCLDYECGLKVSFDQFLPEEEHPLGFFNVSTGSAWSYFNFISSVVNRTANFFGMGFDGVHSDYLYVVSNTNDIVHDGDVHNVADTLCDLHRRLVEVLPSFPDIVVPNPDLPNKVKMEIVDKFVGVRIVYDDGSINVPDKWFSLMPGENIISVTGQVYQMNIMDWIQSIITCGHYYCTDVRKKKFARSAVILTNKRIVEMTLWQRAGVIPSNFNNVVVTTNSYLLGAIKSGIFHSDGQIQV
jgi:hypothetical protein